MVEVPSPQANQTFLNPDGTIKRSWYRFFQQLWERTGGGSDNVAGAAPAGSISQFGGVNAPDGWLICDGSAVSREQFTDLFNAIGANYGAGDGVTTFNIPDGRGRAFIGAGQGDGLTFRSIGVEGGLEDVQLTESELASHTHVVTDPQHNHGVTDPQHSHGVTDPQHDHGNATGNFVNDAGGAEYDNTNGDKGTTNANTDLASTGITVDNALTGVTVDNAVTGITNQNTGGDQAHENMSPFLVGNWIIKT